MERNKLFYVIILLSALLNVTSSAYAQMERGPTKERIPNTRDVMEKKLATGEMQLKRDEMKIDTEEMRETMQQKREEAKEKFETQREEFKKNMGEMKDSRKKTIVENVDLRINELNVQHTERLEVVLSKVSDILGRLEIKISSSEAIATSEATTAINEAKSMIATATEALTTQAGKEYVIDASDEANVRVEARKTFSIFKSDITAVHEKVKAARESVVNVARLYGQVQKNTRMSISPGVSETQ